MLQLPPLPEQERFAQIVARYPLTGTGEKLRSQMRESTRHPAKECGAGAELLFQGLPVLSFTEGLLGSFGGGE